MSYRKKLIEVALPLPEINDASAYDMMPGIGPHPKGIHVWWGRKALPACRAFIFASVVDDPSAHPERFPTEEAQERERERLFGIIRRLMQKQLHKHPEVYAEARAEMLKYCDGKLPPLLDPFAGGGSIPLEAARLGMEAYAGDLNPVAVLLNKCNLEIAPRWADGPPVNPEVRRTYLGMHGPLGPRASRPPLETQASRPLLETQASRPLLGPRASRPQSHEGLPSRPPSLLSRPHKHWHSRGYLPHFDQPGIVQSITFRLHDSVPPHVIETWKDELGWLETMRADDPKAVELRQRIARFEDAGHGECWLGREDIASLVENALLHFDGQRYRLLAWCIMPNHVHVLIETLDGWPLHEVVHGWKSYTAKEANKLLGRTGTFWMPDYYDRFIRSEDHLQAEISYIENNPVKAGLVKHAEEWRFSSACAGGTPAFPGAGGTPAFPGAPGTPAVPEAGGTPAVPGAAGTPAFPGAGGTPAFPGAGGTPAFPELGGTPAFPGAPGTPAAPEAGGAPAFPEAAGTPAVPEAGGTPAVPEAGGTPAVPGWHGTHGLAEDVRYYGRVILERARGKIGHLYPPVKVTSEMAAEHPHLAPYVGRELPVIAWLWARTVASPDPAARGAHVPLMSTFWLSSKKGSEAYLEPVVDRAAGTWRFVVRTGVPKDREVLKAGTKTGRGQFRCLLTSAPITDTHIKAEGKAGRLGARLVAIVADTRRGRVYLPATAEQEAIAQQARPPWKPEARMPNDPRWFSPPLAGLLTYGDLFTPRQLTAMVQLSDLVREVREDVRRDALAAGLSEAEAEEYARAVVTFLALALDRCADFNCALSSWKPSGQQQMHLFGRQAIPMVWDFAEANLVGEKAICWINAISILAEALETIGAKTHGHARLIDAAHPWDGLKGVLVSTDPPYYDNIGYAALSDFFYVWLRRTLGDLYPDLFATILVPKEPELVAAPERFDGDKRKAKEHFEGGFRRAFAQLREKMDPRFPLTVYYAFKQDDEGSGADEEANGNRVDRTTGWETMLTALVETGFQITATWPVRSAQKWRQNAMGTNSLASYIVLACRPRPEDAPQTDRRSFVAELKRELPSALKRLQQGGIAPVDFAQAAIGPGMAIYSKYRRILEASGRPMSVRTALALINQTLTEVLSEQEDEFDADTRWAIAWYEQHGFEEGEFGQAELLSKAKATSVRGLEEAGIVRAGGGRVRLLRPEELPKEWHPERDRRLVVWEMTHHLLRVYYHEKAGDQATAELLRKLGSRGELARDLAYRLFGLAEKRGRSQEAQAYNALVLGWPEIARLAQEAGRHSEQAGLFGT